MNEVTKERTAFEAWLAQWAKANGYRLRGHLWQSKSDYLTAQIEDGVFVVHKRSFGEGHDLGKIDL